MKPFLTAICGLMALCSFSQQESLVLLEKRMQEQIAVMQTGEEDKRLTASDSLHTLMIEALNSNGCFEYPFDSLQMGTLRSPDDAFRLFNWNVPFDDQTHKYHCFVLTKEEKTGIYNWTEFQQFKRPIDKVNVKYLTPEKWLGCLYYDIIPMNKSKKRKRSKKNTYTLLGWDGNDKYSTKKIIEVMTISNGDIRLGAPIFKNTEGSPKRVILEYSSEVMVSLKYHPKQKRIIYDHLAPRDPIMTGVYSYYGPDMTFDAFNLHKGKWVFDENVDIRLGRDNRPFNDPAEN